MRALWSGIAANGSKTNNFGTLSLAGTNSGLNVFSVTGSELQSANSMNISAPAGSTVLVNVSGSASAFQNGQVSLSAGLTESRVLYDFYQATSLDGQLVAKSFSGNTQFHMTSADGIGGGNTYFAGNLPNVSAVPEPSTSAFLAAGLGMMGWILRRRQRSNSLLATVKDASHERGLADIARSLELKLDPLQTTEQ
jgi:hypothetical protein